MTFAGVEPRRCLLDQLKIPGLSELEVWYVFNNATYAGQAVYLNTREAISPLGADFLAHKAQTRAQAALEGC